MCNHKYKNKSLPFYSSGSTGNPMKSLIHLLQGFVKDENSYKYDCVFGLMKSVNFNLDDFAEYYHKNITKKNEN